MSNNDDVKPGSVTEPSGVPQTSGIETRTQSLKNVMYIFDTIGLSEEAKEFLIEEYGIKRVDIVEGMSNDEILNLHNEGPMKRGECQMLKKLKAWCAWYRSRNNSLPREWTVIFDEDALYDFDADAFSDGRSRATSASRDNESVTTNVTVNNNEGFRVKII